jgi:Gram-negative porin
MKRVALLCMGLAVGAASAAEAQLTMQMSNGWSFTFSGNVNAFAVYESTSESGGTLAAPGGLIGIGGKGFNVRTGLLPAFAVFDAKGKEGSTDLGVHFGFAPQIQCGNAGDDAGASQHDCFGAQIDMRQVYLTVGGSWGQILAGREIGLFNRQNILTDQTLFGVGATGGINGGGTTLGRIGFGYIYPNFVAQMTYSTPAGRPGQLSIGLFQPSGLASDAGTAYGQTQVPRVEAEATFKTGDVMVWANGTAQNAKNPVADVSKTAVGAGGGFRFGKSQFSLTGSGYWGKGIGTTLQFNGVGGGNGAVSGLGVGTDGDLRTSYGFIGQVTFTPASSKVTIAGSYGSSYLKSTDGEPTTFKTENSLISGGIYFQATKSLKVVGEGNYAWTKEHEADTDKNKTFAPTFGLMLFF